MSQSQFRDNSPKITRNSSQIFRLIGNLGEGDGSISPTGAYFDFYNDFGYWAVLREDEMLVPQFFGDYLNGNGWDIEIVSSSLQPVPRSDGTGFFNVFHLDVRVTTQNVPLGVYIVYSVFRHGGSYSTFSAVHPREGGVYSVQYAQFGVQDPPQGDGPPQGRFLFGVVEGYPRWRCNNGICEQYQAVTETEGFATQADCVASGCGSSPAPPPPGPQVLPC